MNGHIWPATLKCPFNINIYSTIPAFTHHFSSYIWCYQQVVMASTFRVRVRRGSRWAAVEAPRGPGGSKAAERRSKVGPHWAQGVRNKWYMILFRPLKASICMKIWKIYISPYFHEVFTKFRQVLTKFSPPRILKEAFFVPVGILAKRLLGSGPIFVL